MIVKKFKKGRGDEPGVIQVKLAKLASGKGVVLNVVDENGVRVSQGSMLTIDRSGVNIQSSFGETLGLPMDNTRSQVRVN